MSSATLQLWEHLFGELEGYLATYTARRNGERLEDKNQTFWFYPEAREKAADYLQRQSAAGREAYFGVHLFKTAANRRAENAADQIGALWVDGDGAKVPETWPQPTAVVESSPGREHFYWKLSHPVDQQIAAQLNKRLAYGMGGDTGKWQMGTVLRAPGTYNYKRAEPTEVGGGVVA